MTHEIESEREERQYVHLLLHQASQCADALFLLEMSSSGLTPRQYTVLLTVSQYQGLSQTQLVERSGIDRSTLGSLVKRLLKKGLLVRRRTKADARTYAVNLTEQGLLALRAAEKIAARVDTALLAGLPPNVAAEFIASLNTIVGTFHHAKYLPLKNDGLRNGASSAPAPGE